VDDGENVQGSSSGAESAGGSSGGTESAGGSSGDDHSTGGGGSSGGRNVGSETDSSTGGVITVHTIDPLPTVRDCGQLPPSSLDPPCSEEDIIGEGGCYADRVQTIAFPLEGLQIPAGRLNLQLLLLPSEASFGLGGAGGTPSGVPLLVWLSPHTGGSVDGYDFEVSGPEIELFAQVFFEEPRFVPTLLTYGDPYLDWIVVRIALTADGAILSERRAIFSPNGICIR
jgi:hypothetical protein